MTERRLHHRVEMLAQVQVSRHSDVHIMDTRDISRGGVFIQGDPAASPEIATGVDLDLVLFFADNVHDEVSVRATVVRVVEPADATPDNPAGFGLRFTLFTPGHDTRLTQILANAEERA